ncbi:YqhR family membrane protein [Neobacillus niacini]|uniref:YqhR family membrane protein n=1 Tax=Neobacillus niacini TaxID=86668 RepID=UPI00285B62A9|nr:YqhR family membrane protein [Neobacillus niacini]MDR6998710.1 putative membrane protein YagU involved in acid resistance [Neobacillus niacini]
MGNDRKEKTYPKPMSFPVMVFWTGLIGGLFWSTIGWLAYYFSFTEIRPNVILEPWAFGSWKYGWIGTLISIILLGVISVVAAFIYYAALRKFTGFWVGLGYGIVLFLLVFFVLNPLFPSIDPLVDLNRDTLISSVCLYIVYGIFIGYSINYEYQNTEMKAKETSN